MSRPALFSYEGALRVLGKYERPLLDKADTFLGVGILVGGAIEPNLLDLVDPKNEATACLRKILDGITDKLTGLSGTHRHEQIAAAHTIIAVTSVFEAFREEIGDDFDKFKITDSEKFRIFSTEPPARRKEVSALPSLTAIAVPSPSATRGFHENLEGALGPFLGKAVADVCKFLDGLDAKPARISTLEFVSAVTLKARSSYTHHYLGIAAAIPEFQIWALLGEHAATRAVIEENNVELARELAAVRTESLELFSRLMALLSSGQTPPGQKYREKLKTVAEAALRKPLIGSNIDPSSVDAVFPKVEDGFIVPSYRLTVYDEYTGASSGEWWKHHTEVRQDLDAFLAAHLAGAESTTCPLLVLGNPGAGKSLLMEVLAARLPADQFTVVTVQLRKVRAEDRICDQIETALRDVLGKNVDWEQLAEACGDSVPVVLLDGFDELIQASGVHQSTYLKQVQEFQQLQADLRHPVAVVITSRMLVADRARIPHGVPIVKLEEFDDGRIERWLNTWNAENLNTPGFRSLDLAALSHHADLARQPLLLLMLAIYATDPDQPPLDDPNLSNSELYRRLIQLFVMRQVGQKGPAPLAPAVVTRLAAKSSWRLGIAAFAMFNRGHQYVTAVALNKDLAVFAPTPKPNPGTSFDTPIDDADRTVENFFFVHSPTLNDGASPGLRTYEFLHATFGEYLIAEVTMNLLRSMATAGALPTADPFEEARPPDEPKLLALTSHRVFAKRKPITEFARGLFSSLPKTEQVRVLQTLDDLIRSFHDRTLSDPHPAYRPTSATAVSRIATYSANLVCLRVLLDVTAPPPVDSLFPSYLGEVRLTRWRATVRLWQSGLDLDGWDAVCGAITLVETDAWYITEQEDNFPRQGEARLLGDARLEAMLSIGGRFASSDVGSGQQEQRLLSDLADWLLNSVGTGGTGSSMPLDVVRLSNVLQSLDEGAPMNHSARAIMAVALSREAPRLPRSTVERALKHIMPRTSARGRATRRHAFDLISVICAHPELAGSEVVPVELLPAMFEFSHGDALGSLVLVWTALNSDLGRANDSFRAFATQVEEAAAPYLDRVSISLLPVGTIEYLAEPRKTEPTLDRSLFAKLAICARAGANQVSPQAVAKLLERFRGKVDEKMIFVFAERYLDKRTTEFPASDQEAVSTLRQIAQRRPD
ncbi:ATP-binding protein [Lentzea sp. PSKA42]|uniref:ATP-binding protein n=1 Tax=Lentzea indica TaxID=2604800 RepID=A0ABX1FFH0_9PSEU|nr:ATP-binding protein [Lentzea indica]NKE57708.1 ATP-binding protein [Lentzea indica]